MQNPNKNTLRISRSLAAMAMSGRLPSRRSLAAMAKLCGRRLERHWPFLPRASQSELNLGFDDLLSLQYARSRKFNALIVGAFDGVTNDPTGEFIQNRNCRAIFVEPQPGPFSRLGVRMSANQNVTLINAAIDEISGDRLFYSIPSGIAGLPDWTEQLASFNKQHLLNHENKAPGLTMHIVESKVPTLSFDDLLNKYSLKKMDLLQIDAEGMDAQLLEWFPFERLKPALLHYEVAHMTSDQKISVTSRLKSFGYMVLPSDSPTDDMAIQF